MVGRRRLSVQIAGGLSLIAAVIVVKAEMSYAAQRYLDAAFLIIQTHSIKRRDIDWDVAESNRPRARVLDAVYRSPAAAAPVAILTSRLTASSGEAVVIAFVGRPNTRIFGKRTRGLSTSNDQFFLSDGAMINLTVATLADRNGHVYPNGIDPDETADAPPGSPVSSAALEWLQRQPACRASGITALRPPVRQQARPRSPRGARRAQRLIQIGKEVVRVFDADR